MHQIQLKRQVPHDSNAVTRRTTEQILVVADFSSVTSVNTSNNDSKKALAALSSASSSSLE